MADMSEIFINCFFQSNFFCNEIIKVNMNIWDKIYNYTIFNGLDKNEIKALTFCFKSKVRKYEKNEVIVNKGERFDNIVLIISGQAKVVNYMQNGNVNMNSKLNVGDIFGAIELFTRLPMLVKAGLTSDIINFVIVCAVFFALNYGVFTFCIKKFKIPTPGRLGNYDEEESSAQNEAAVTSNDLQALNIIELLGSKENIEDVDACMTRLRVTVKDLDKVASEDKWKQNGALGLILKGNGVQAIYGPKADMLKNNIQDIIGV